MPWTDPRPTILHRVEQLGMAVFTRGSYNLNLIGVRSPARRAGRFDDHLVCVYKDNEQRWHTHEWAATTDPGTYWLAHPMRAQVGTAILVPGQYRGAYVVGRHHGYDALVQDRPMRFWRDRDRDADLDFDDLTISSEVIGANIHAADSNPFDAIDTNPLEIGRWSAGCQVLQHAANYRELWSLVGKATMLWGPRFTFTLLED
jgi:hypothetical protein